MSLGPVEIIIVMLVFVGFLLVPGALLVFLLLIYNKVKRIEQILERTNQ